MTQIWTSKLCLLGWWIWHPSVLWLTWKANK